VRELADDNPGSIANASRFLAEHARPGDIVLTNYEWEPLYFHTRLPQALKILPEYPIHTVARAHALPEYVFKVDGARWMVWRSIWDGYRGYDGSRLYSEMLGRGAKLERMISFPDTMWENRSNLHFHRFANGRYLYPFFGDVPEQGQAKTHVYRIDWAK
jgi:hypothetical protein